MLEEVSPFVVEDVDPLVEEDVDPSVADSLFPDPTVVERVVVVTPPLDTALFDVTVLQVPPSPPERTASTYHPAWNRYARSCARTRACCDGLPA